jgi:GNAT superfamily N-acetyltransferase
MPLSNSLYAWLLALVAYGTIDFQDYTLLHTSEKGFRVYLDQTENFIINESIDNPLIAYNLTTMNYATNSWQQFLIGIKTSDGKLIAGLVGYIHYGMLQGVKSNLNCEIGLLWVDEAYRHQGLGTLLIEQAEHYAAQHNCKAIKTGVFETDHASGFFTKMNFDYKVTKPSPKHLKNHAVYEVMSKKIDCDATKAPTLPTSFIENKYQIYVGQPFNNTTPLDILRFASAMNYQEIAKTFIDPVINFIFFDEVKNMVADLQKKLSDYRKDQGGSKIVNPCTIFIVSPDNKIVGGAIGHVENFPGYGNWLHIDDVGIDENYRKHNLGRLLFEQIDAYARSKDCNFLELWTGQWQARGFYEKVGLHVIATFPASEHDWNQEGYILRKYLE